MSVTFDLTGNVIKADGFTGSDGTVVTIGDPSSLTALTDSTGGTASSTLAAITAGSSYAQADMVAVKNALASIAAQLSDIIDVLKDS